ncbi:DUF4183 domain-containing protein [Bacillus marasmi]|uniref:DUF4183 domain-containing protein n=1 Tax=Bacillus marasmi TaxID=1926279 RepID=UPI0011C93104|nr:DUF4183 domain-containing protein [Bacillus marasmi]
MALQLMKLYVGVTTTVDADPENTRFFYVTGAPTAAGATLNIDAAAFFMDNGDPNVELPVLEADNSYYNVYVNGVLQMEGLSTYTPGITAVGSLAIDVPAGGPGIPMSTPVVLEVVNFTPTASNTVET